MMSWYNVLGFLLNFLGLILNIYYGRKSITAMRERRRFSWEDVESGTRGIIKKVMKDFKPDMLLAFSGPGALVANLAMVEIGRFVPLFTGMVEDLKSERFSFTPQDHVPVTTTRWNIFIPKCLLSESNRKLVIIDDSAISGGALLGVRQFLIDNGFERENVYLATLVCTQMALEWKQSPDYYWFPVQDSDFYFPWGKGG